MSIKQRIRALEQKHKFDMGSKPWLIFDIDGKPTLEQQQSMDEANRMGKAYIFYIMPSDTIYVSLLKHTPPWQN